MTRRLSFRAAMIGMLAMSILTGTAMADSFPSRPIRIVVPYAAGGPTDALARIVGKSLQERLGQPVIIDNKPGASGMIGAAVVAAANPDGYTILINASLHVITPSLYAKPTNDPINDFTAITDLGSVPLIMVVNKDLPVKSVSDLITYAKANPGKLTFGSSGIGASSHLAGEMLKSLTAINMSHVPYRGSAPALSDTIAGHISMMIDTSPASLPHVEAGSLRVLGVSTAQRISVLPNVPTIAEAGVPGFEISSWYGVWGPKAMPQELVNRIQKEFAKTLAEPSIQESFAKLSATPGGRSSEEFGKFSRLELERWGKIVKESGAKIE